MVRTRAKKKASSLNTVSKKEDAENVLTGKQTDSVMKEEEPKLRSESEGKKEITADKDGNYENKETNADHGDENTVVREMYDEVEPELNTSEDGVEMDDQEDEMWDDEDSEENVKNSVYKDEVNNDEAIEEQDDDFDGTSEEEAMGEEDSEEVEYSEESMGGGDEEHSEKDRELTEAAGKDTEQNVRKAISSKKIEKSNECSGRLKKVEKSGEGTERKLEKSSEGTKRKLEKSSEGTKRKLEKSSEKSGKKVQVQMLKKVGTRDRPESSSKGKMRKRVASMGMIFMCSSKTKDDCYKYMVLGLPESKKDIVEKIYVGMRLFLYDVDQKLMHGIYKAAGPGGFNIEPNAFKSQFPAQVRFTVLDDCLPLSEEKFRKVIKDNYFTNTKFDGQLNSEQVKKMCKLFVSTSKGKQLKKFGRLGKSVKSLPVRESTKRPIVGDKRRLAPKEDPRYHERSHKRLRKVISSTAPSRRSPLAPLSPTLPLYASGRSTDVGVYRRNPHLENRSRYKERQDPVLSRREPYRDWRDAPTEHDRYRDGRDINMVSRYPDREERDINLVSRYPIRDERDPYIFRAEPYLEHRHPNRDGRDPYRERRDSYRDERDPYLRIRDSYKDSRDSYMDRRGSYTNRTYSTTYDIEKRDLLSNCDRIYKEVQGVDYRDMYRRELSDRDNLLPLSLESRRRHEIGSSRDSYAASAYQRSSPYTDPVYSSEYASRLDLAREYHL